MTKKKDQDRRKEFLVEAEDILALLGKSLLELEKSYRSSSISPALLNRIFRSAHTLKGVCSVFDLNEMIQLSHSLEDTLDNVRLGRIALTDDIIDGLMWAHGLLARMAASSGEDDFASELSVVSAFILRAEAKGQDIKRVDKLSGEIVEMLTEYETHRLSENIKADKKIFIVETMLPISELDKEYCALTSAAGPEAEVVATLPSKKEAAEGMVYMEVIVATDEEGALLTKRIEDSIEWKFKVTSAKRKIKAGGEGKKKAAAPPSEDALFSGPSLRSGTDTVRVNIGKLDTVMNVVGELGMMRGWLTKLAADLKNESPYSRYGRELSRLDKYFDRRFDELRDGIIDIRMVQIGQLFSRYETLLSRLCRTTGKEVRMVTNGDDTELDKLMVEKLADPLMHIIRNVVDHGIESPKLRQRLGKERTGTITMNATQRGNRVTIEVHDDGCGIDVENIRRRAVEKGFLTEEEAMALGRAEVLDLIFLPWFSTKDVVSEVSGRGVGLDVVKDSIARLSGTVEIDTIKEKGTRLVLTIPITLAIVQALLMEDTDERYALPLSSVNEVITISPDDIISVDGVLSVRHDDKVVPLVRLATFMGKEPEANGALLNGVVVRIADQMLCVAGERIIEQLDVVVKPLSSLVKVAGVTGAADLGMGEDMGTVLVLDVSQMMEIVSRDDKGIKHAPSPGSGLRPERLH